MNIQLISIFLAFLGSFTGLAISAYQNSKRYTNFSRNLNGNLKLLEVSNAIYIKKEEQTWLKTLLNPFKMKKVT